jgi:hypothetical protein
MFINNVELRKVKSNKELKEEVKNYISVHILNYPIVYMNITYISSLILPAVNTKLTPVTDLTRFSEQPSCRAGIESRIDFKVE